MEDQEKEPEIVEQEATGGKKNIIIIAVVAVAMLAAGIFGGPVVRGMFASDPDEGVEEVAEEKVEEQEPAGKDAIYQGIHPPLLVNFTDSRGKARFLQITLELMTRDASVVEALKTHNAVIRNNLILLYGDIDYDEVTSREGKTKMLAEALAEINAVMTKQTGKPGVEAVYFTNLIVQ